VWAFIGSLSFIAALVLGIMSLVSKIRKNGKSKKQLIYAGALFALFIVAIAASPKVEEKPVADAKSEDVAKKEEAPKAELAKADTKTAEAGTAAEDKAKADEKAKADAAAKAKADADAKEKAKQEAAEKKKQQDAVVAFEKEAYALEDSVKGVMTTYQDAMNGVADGTVDVFTAYSAAEQARDAAEHLQMAYMSLDVPEGLPKKASEALSEAKTNLSTAYYSKKKAFDAVLKFLDDQKPSYMSKFQEETKMSDSFLLAGVAKIFEAKAEVGIDLAKK